MIARLKAWTRHLHQTIPEQRQRRLRRPRHDHVRRAAPFLQAPCPRGQLLGRVAGTVAGLNQLAMADLEEAHSARDRLQDLAREIGDDAHPVPAEATGEAPVGVREQHPWMRRTGEHRHARRQTDTNATALSAWHRPKRYGRLAGMKTEPNPYRGF